MDTAKFEELLGSGKLPSRLSFCALLLLVIYSHELTPQFNQEDRKHWPVCYVSDRELAQSAATALLECVLKDELMNDIFGNMKRDLEQVLTKIDSKFRQRDLLDPDDLDVNFHHQIANDVAVLAEEPFVTDMAAPFGSRSFKTPQVYG